LFLRLDFVDFNLFVKRIRKRKTKDNSNLQTLVLKLICLVVHKPNVLAVEY